MNPEDPEQPSLLKPDTNNQPAAAFSSGMPDPFARQAAQAESTQPTALEQTNSTAAETLSGYDKTKENIYTIDSPADGYRQSPPTPEPNFPMNTFNQAAPPPAPNNAPTPAPTPTSPSDYLDQIATQKPSLTSKFFSNKFFVIGAILGVLIIVTIVLVAAVGGGNKDAQQAAVAVGTELSDLQTLVNYGKSNVKSSTNVKSTAETSLVVLTQQFSLSQLFTLTDEKNPPPAPEFVTELDSAQASGNVETVYTDAMKEQLDQTYIALENLEKQTTSAEKQTALAQAKADIEELYLRITEQKSS